MQVNKMRIAIDLDGVVFNHMKAFCKSNGVDFDYTTKPMPYQIEKVLNIPKEKVVEMFENIKAEDVELLPKAKEGIQFLSSFNQIFFLTSKTPKMLEWTKQVLKREGLDIYPLMVSRLKQDENCYDLLIEDFGEIAVNCTKNKKQCWLINQAWNWQYKDIPRYNNLYDLARQLEYITKGRTQ